MAVLWDATDKSGSEVELAKFAEAHYELIIEWPGGNASNSIQLDRKNLKDLFDAIGHELNAF